MASSHGDLPADVLTEILLKLPVKSIIRFKCVSKTWCHLFQNPTFVSQHLSLSKKNNYLLVVYHEQDKNRDKAVMRLFGYQTFVSYQDLLHDLRQQFPNRFTNVYISFCVYNGVFCLLPHRINSLVTLWNPATREFRILPECNQNIPSKIRNSLHILGFRLDPLSNDYKVIYIRTYLDLENNKRGRHHAIYKMNTDSWRVLEDEDVHFFKDLHICPNCNDACVNGVYYWQVSQMPQLGLIHYKVLAFDLSTEVFQLIESPISGRGKLLPLLDDRISIWDTERIETSERSNEIWVLNDEGQWTKLLKIDPLLEVERMFGFWKNGKVFVESESGRLLLYDLDTVEFSDLGIKAKEAGDLDVYTYEESLVAIARE
ncbi:hypothetical protein REPUB_Repub13aG0063600 [Reevesia pubescens]